MSTHNLCFKQKSEKYQNFLSENFHFLVVKCSIYLNRLVLVMGIQYNFNDSNKPMARLPRLIRTRL